MSSLDQPPMPKQMVEKIIGSHWFTRAWTLQELIAPTQVIFYDAKFRHLGSRVDFTTEIEQAFAIPADVLINPQRLSAYPIAVRMSWAARRRATRTEDIAYSLFGLFGVNLPLLYGEGTRSFLRLQEEIIRQTHDHSIFIWSSQRRRKRQWFDERKQDQLPLLASSPADFEDCQDIILRADTEDVRPYAMTNVGLQIELKIFPYDLNIYVGLLDCASKSTKTPFGILVAKQDDKSTTWRRLRLKDVDVVKIQHTEKLKDFVWQKMYIVKDTSPASNNLRNPHQTDSSLSHTPFYGMHIDAPAFLAGYSEANRPYALVAHNDWNMTLRNVIGGEDGEYLQPGYTAHTDARLTPSSHMGLAMSIDKTLTLTGLRRSIRRKTTEQGKVEIDQSNTDNKQRPETDNQESQPHRSDGAGQSITRISLGVLAMPLMSTGTAGVIIFDHVVHGIRSIKAGFDFNFRPVMFIATHEAEVDPQIQTWMQQKRFVNLEWFERHCNLLDSLSEGGDKRFWTLRPDYLKDREDLEVCEDGSISIDKGVYAFTIEATAQPEHWVFKPYESQHWHLALGLERREYGGLVYWEFTIDKRDDLVKLEFELVS